MSGTNYFVLQPTSGDRPAYTADPTVSWAQGASYAGLGSTISCGVAYGDALDRWLVTTAPFTGGGAISNDAGATWATQSPGDGENNERATYAFGAYFVGTNNFSIYRSATALASSWVSVQTGLFAAFGFGNAADSLGILAACGTNDGTAPAIQYAVTPGTSWTIAPITGLASNKTLQAIGYDPDRALWFAVNVAGQVYTTADITAGPWSLIATVSMTPGAAARPAFAFKPGGSGQPIVLADGAGLRVSNDDGATWSGHALVLGGLDVTWSEQFEVFVGGGGVHWGYSADGASWTEVSPPGGETYAAIGKRFTPSPGTAVPDVLGLSVEAATAAIIAAGFILGTVSTTETNDFPANSVLSQFPAGGTIAVEGTAVSITIAVPRTNVIPNVLGMTLADAEITIRAAGFTVGPTTVTTEPLGALGTVVFQAPPGGSIALPGVAVSLTSTALFPPFEVDETVISQYTTSPTIMRLVHDLAQYVDPRVNMTEFYNLVWNVDTAVGFGLDIWGRIVGVSRLLRLPSTDPIFGFDNADDPPDWQPFNQGIFFPGSQASQAFLLPDDPFRTLILTKALSNIVATNAASLNQLLRNLFPGRGKAYVQDLGGMAMRFVFEFALTSTEYAILTQSGALPHPAGVSYSVVVIPVASGLFGFREAGSTSRPFNFGVFYLPTGP